MEKAEGLKEEVMEPSWPRYAFHPRPSSFARPWTARSLSSAL